MPYYETSLEPKDCVFIAFQEIVARPLINDYIVRLIFLIFLFDLQPFLDKI